MIENLFKQYLKFFKFSTITLSLTLISSCSEFLTVSEEYYCEDSKGIVDNFVLDIQRSFFANSNLMKIPSKASALGVSRNICSENDDSIEAGSDCRGEENEKRSLTFNKSSGKLEIYVSPTIIRKATCKSINQ